MSVMHEASYTRHVESRLREVLEDSPVVLIQGPRQCGKTTLARIVGRAGGHHYISFDDEDARAAAEGDLMGFVRTLPERVILDEVQKVPEIFSSIKLAVDRDRTPGRFILTGSVSVPHVRGITDSLAGRMDIIRLHPFSQSELEGSVPGFPDALFSSEFDIWRDRNDSPEMVIMDKVAAGGYPVALQRSGERRADWYRKYVEMLVERDSRDIAAVRSPEILSSLLALAAAQTARLLSVNGLSSSFRLSRNTVQDYLFLLEKMFLLEKLPAWHSNHLKRLVRTPKLHVTDTGIACALMRMNAAALSANRLFYGHLLETWVLQELRRQLSGHGQPHAFSHYREKDGAEVDIVIERGASALAGVEVKASATVRDSDFRGLRRLRAAAGDRFSCGVVLYNGDRSLRFGEGLYAVPLRSLWETGQT